MALQSLKKGKPLNPHYMYARIAVTGCGGRNQRAQRNRHAQTALSYNQKTHQLTVFLDIQKTLHCQGNKECSDERSPASVKSSSVVVLCRPVLIIRDTAVELGPLTAIGIIAIQTRKSQKIPLIPHR